MSQSKIQPTVVVDGISMKYKVRSRIKRFGTEDFHALRDVNFIAQQGESIGMLGQNGSGKSTLLNIIAGSEMPTSGQVLTRSQPRLMGVGAALQQRLSGEKNITIGCLAMGMEPDQVEENIQEIIDFADIGDAIYRPMSTYSWGQSARLRFAIGTSMKPEILLIDEALSTGDAAFASKAEKRMQKVLESAGTVFLVSHAMKQIRDNCERAIWIHNSTVIADGPAEEVCSIYENWSSLKGQDKTREAERLLDDLRNLYENPIIEY